MAALAPLTSAAPPSIRFASSSAAGVASSSSASAPAPAPASASASAAPAPAAHRGAPSLSTLAMKGAGSPDPLLRRLEAMAALAVSSAPGGVKAR
jgi:hypothetical protein